MTRTLRYLLFLTLLSLQTAVINGQSTNLLIYERISPNSSYILKSNELSRDSISVINKLESKLYKNLSKGYVLSGYDSIIWDSTNVRAYFTQNDKYIWENFDYSVLTKEVKNKKIKFPKQNQNFNHIDLLKNINLALEQLSNQGYPFSKITMDPISFKGNKVSAKLNIDKGERYYFDTIIIRGNTKLRNYYFQKLTNIKKGEVFSNYKINKLNSQINSIKFINQTNDYQLAFKEDKISLLLYLEDKKLSFFNGIIGIIPDNKTSKQVLITGDLDLSLINTIGFGETFLLKWQKFESMSQNLATEISVPYILKTNFGLGSNFYLEKKDTSYLNTDLSARIIYGNNHTNGFELFYRNKSSFIISNDKDKNDDISDYSTNLIGLNYRYSKTDNKLNHRKAFIINLSTGIGTKNLKDQNLIKDSISKNIFHSLATIDIIYSIPIGKHMSIKTRNLNSITHSKILKENELDYIGGLSTIRGFNEKSLSASAFYILNTDIKYHFDEESAFFTFIDLGYLKKTNTKINLENFVLGTGIGLDLETKIGIFSIIYAIGKHNKDHLSFSNSKIHFGYKNNF